MDEKAELSPLTKLLFLITNVLIGGGVTWSIDICRKCVKQRYVLSFLVLLGLLVVVAFLL